MPFVFPYFDHDALMHHTMHVPWTPLQTTKSSITLLLLLSSIFSFFFCFLSFLPLRINPAFHNQSVCLISHTYMYTRIHAHVERIKTLLKRTRINVTELLLMLLIPEEPVLRNEQITSRLALHESITTEHRKSSTNPVNR